MTEKKEEKKEMSQEQKNQMEEQRKKMEEMQKKQMEEQMRAKKEQLNMTLKQLAVSRKLVECTIDRMKADCDVVEKVEMPAEGNELKKKALSAKLAEMNAQMDTERLKLEMIDLNEDNVKMQLENIDKMPAMPRMPPGMMGRPPM